MANYVLLEKIVVGPAGASSVTFSGIPQTGYTDLVLKGSVRTTQAATYGTLTIRPNGSTANITGIRMYAGDGNVYSDNTPSLALISGDATGANTFGSFETYIANYASSSFKTFTSQGTGERNQTNDTYMGTSTILWSDTTAITSLQIMPSAVGFIPGSTLYLYGVAKSSATPAIAPKATGGDTIMSDGTYWYHAFRSSGTFTPAAGLSCDVLVVAGGGSGFYSTGAGGVGGGGAGGVIYFTSQSLSSGSSNTVTVGAGGASTAGTYNSGSNSQFASLTAAIGGGGGGAGNGAGNAGGSGGGAGESNSGSNLTGGTATQTGTGATAYYGNAGGSCTYNTTGAGGGGASAVGGVPTSASNAGVGGAGTNAYSSWATVTSTGVSGYYAGGGGGAVYLTSGTGGTGGAGGGGNGTANGIRNEAVPGTANTGGGGGALGGSLGNIGSTAGGSGLVIVRYAV